MAKKVAKKTVKKVTSKNVPAFEEVVVTNPTMTSVAPKANMNPRYLSMGLIVLAIALLTYKVGPYFVPAMVDNTPITRFALWSRLEQSSGTQSLDDLINEKILDKAIAKSGIKVEESKINDQLTNLENQFKDIGGLDETLKQRGMTRDDLKKQIKTQLSVEEVLKDKITPSDDEVKAAFEAGKATTYKGKNFEDVQANIKEELTQTKLREEFLSWFEGVKAEFKVKNFGL